MLSVTNSKWQKICALVLLHFSLLTTSACKSSSATTSAQMKTLKLESVGENFCISIPSAYAAQQISNVEDFLLYRIVDPSAKLQLLVYFGNQPKVIMAAGAKKDFSIGSYPAEYIEEKAIDGWKGEVLIKLLAGGGWPEFSHMQFSRLDDDEHRIALDIIESLRNKQGGNCH